MTLRSKVGGHLIAILGPLIAGLMEGYGHVPIDDKSRCLVMLVPIASATWVGGVGPGLIGLMISSLICAYFLPPSDSLLVTSPADVLSLVLFVIVSLVVIGIIESLRKSWRALAESEANVRGLNADLTASLGAQAEALEHQKQFTSDVSHELKTPLTAIRARSGVALGSQGDAEELIEHIVAMNRSADTMVSIVQDLALLAASDEGRLPLRKERCAVQTLVEDALASVDITHRDVSSDVDLGLQLDCDPSAMTRVLVNLLQNAVVHTPAGCAIHIEAQAGNGIVTLLVRDEGSGISPEDLGRIFDRFYRADRSRDRESGGSGLGLAIVKAIVEGHGGTISIESKAGEGTTVSIALPKPGDATR